VQGEEEREKRRKRVERRTIGVSKEVISTMKSTKRLEFQRSRVHGTP
jgi:hypothetical protein